MAKSHITVSSGGAAAGGGVATHGSGGVISNIQVTAAQTPQGVQAYTNAYQAAIANGATKQQALQQGMAAQNAADAAQLQQQSTQQAQQTQQQPTTPTSTTSPFGDNNGGFKDGKDLVKNQAKIEAWLDSIENTPVYTQGGAKKTPQWMAAEAMGFNKPPKVHDSLMSLPDQNDRIPIFRGVDAGGGKTAGQNAQDFKKGENFPGVGIYVDGIYFQLSYSGAQSYAGSYSDKSRIISASINTKNMRIIDVNKLEKMQKKILNDKNISKRVSSLIARNQAMTKSGNIMNLRNANGNSSALGTLATLLGYDAIYIPGGNGGYVAKNQPTKTAGNKNDFFCILIGA